MFRKLALLVVSVSVALSVVRAQDNNNSKKEDPPPNTAVNSLAATSDPNYLIGPQDVLDINVWKETELKRSVPRDLSLNRVTSPRTSYDQIESDCCLREFWVTTELKILDHVIQILFSYEDVTHI